MVLQVNEHHRPNKHRKELIALFALLINSWHAYILRQRHELLGLLLYLAGKDGRIETRQLAQVRQLIDEQFRNIVTDLDEDFHRHAPAAILAGAKMGGALTASAAAILAAEEVIAHGALGVPFEQVASAASFRARNAIIGILTRNLLDEEKTIKATELEITKAIDAFTVKATGEVVTQLNAAAVAATIETVATNDLVEEMLYVLNPYTDNHCPICAFHAGNIYPKNHPVWKKLPFHAHCECYPEPILTRSGVHHNQELVA